MPEYWVARELRLPQCRILQHDRPELEKMAQELVPSLKHIRLACVAILKQRKYLLPAVARCHHPTRPYTGEASRMPLAKLAP